ncbi:Folylpolyglutamate synthase [Erysiphe neolycopersici]|uniref:tetrahydrofolate synthase n=1 Tax=Erysiphe neolycopersici TaxID=212602 RepID=A0A420HS45_9PEZI|nr:Folylpolyglutamate synthase [Erysiphe neolycopersici]
MVHVTGTKGKGSTCAFVDSILNQHRTSHGISMKVGLYTSPHLISVRERIRINSSNISAETFAGYFFQVWDRFDQPLKEKDGRSILLERPSYFRFLTLLSFHVFLQEKVDAAIYEVGIGGEYDSTNIVENPLATGISTIGIDHTSVLGNTISEIAWHKAGIIKRNCPNFYVDQELDALTVINSRAAERQAKVENVTILPQLEKVHIRPNAKFQKQNASLAVNLAHVTLQQLDPNYNYTLPSADPLPDAFKNGLEKVIWRGRCEKKEEEDLTWYLDGAHNKSSIQIAINWFTNEIPVRNHENVRTKTGGLRILIFNQQGRRDLTELLNDLFKETRFNNLQFDHVIFCPTVHGQNTIRKGKFLILFSVFFSWCFPHLNFVLEC